MLRKFTSGSFIKFALGSSAVTGAASFAAIVKLTNTELGSMVSYLDAGGSNAEPYYDFQVEASKLEIYKSGASRAIEVGALGGVWVLVAATKASGTAAARLHLYRFDTETWTHENGGAAIGNASENVGGKLVIGQWQGSEQFVGLYAASAVWNKALTDGEVEALVEVTAISKWKAKGPVGMWMLNQESTSEKVLDFTGNGADESSHSGTEVVAGSPPIPFTEGEEGEEEEEEEPEGATVMVDVGGVLVAAKRYVDVGGELISA